MSDSDPHATFGYVARRLDGYGLAYLHVVEPRVRGNDDIDAAASAVSAKDLRQVFKGPLIAAGGFTADSARRIIEAGDADLVAFGRLFISNPDLPERLRVGGASEALRPLDLLRRRCARLHRLFLPQCGAGYLNRTAPIANGAAAGSPAAAPFCSCRLDCADCFRGSCLQCELQ